jgi:hypothetical protein
MSILTCPEWPQVGIGSGLTGTVQSSCSHIFLLQFAQRTLQAAHNGFSQALMSWCNQQAIVTLSLRYNVRTRRRTCPNRMQRCRSHQLTHMTARTDGARFSTSAGSNKAQASMIR